MRTHALQCLVPLSMSRLYAPIFTSRNPLTPIIFHYVLFPRDHANNTDTCPRPTTSLDVKVKVNVGDGEPVESALRRFKRAVSASGHLIELRHKRYFENSQERKKRKIKERGLRVKFERMQRKRMAKRT